ncbi:hypothetical protein CAPTEDRAFT_191692 [Capitella teleta]|uniref:Centromere protein K n=1 Tax=Capitella teleta TaxID=283909 RepID=R7V5U7_CAPTE|nr:hypothetical protein CAPTEDRAFT_191692 [Capitella teleta]|eukprot:ELU14223.1 hypothetical protein CAPTEDRAFT_191692 [Capitella teleta]
MSTEESMQILKSQCDSIQNEISELQKEINRLGLNAKKTDARNPLKSINDEKEKLLEAQIHLLASKEPAGLPQKDDSLNLALLKREMETTNSELEKTLIFVEANNEEILSNIEREKKTQKELQQIQSSLREKLSHLRLNPEESQSAPGRVNQLVSDGKTLSTEHKKLMKAMGLFIKDHFPPPNPDQMDLMNSCINHPHDPYLTLTPEHWPPYVELLLRCGLALCHPNDASRIKLTPFHL